MTHGKVRTLHFPTPEWQQGLAPKWMIAVFFLLICLVFSRRPGDLFHACFYAEDGVLWFSEAYNLHWAKALLIPNASYLQVLPRLVAGLALLPSLKWAPLVLNLAGAVLQVLPAMVLLSPRTSTWGPLPLRALLIAVYFASPNTREVHVNITNSQWHFAFLQLLLALGSPPRRWFGKAFEIVVFSLGALSGPFAFVLLPILLISWFQRKERWLLVLTACLIPGLLLQAHVLHYGYALASLKGNSAPIWETRSNQALGATPSLFFRIVGGCVFLDSMIGHTPLDKGPLVLPICFFFIGVFVVGCGMVYGPRPFRLLALYTVVLFAAALRSPNLVDTISRWHGLSLDGGMRYYFLPMVVYLWSAVYTLWSSPPKVVRRLCLIPLCILVLGLARWIHKPFPPRHFDESVARFNQAKAGEAVRIAINPAPWEMTLIKH